MKPLTPTNTKVTTANTSYNVMFHKKSPSPKRMIVDCQFGSVVEFDDAETAATAAVRCVKTKRRRTTSESTPDPLAPYTFSIGPITCHTNSVDEKEYSPISSIDTVDDVFMNILSYLVGPNSIDDASLHSMNLVNKRWYNLVSSQRFWRCVPKPRTSHESSYSTAGSGSSSLNAHLAGYKNLGRNLTREIHSTCDRTSFRTVEKSSGKLFHLDITSTCIGENIGHGHPSTILREIAVYNDMQRLKSESEYSSSNTPCSFAHISLIQDWQSLDDGRMLCWYEQEDETLRSFMNKIDRHPELVKGILFQVLVGLATLHHCNLVYRNLCADDILLFWEGSADKVREDLYSGVPLVKIRNFIHCRGVHVLDADGSPLEYGLSSDMLCFGELFREVYSALSKGQGHLTSSKSSMKEEGADLLGCLFRNAENRITASEALKHPYFSTVSSPRRAKNIAFSPRSQLRLLNMVGESALHCHLNVHQTVLPSEQWATLTDWLFEIVSVFNKSTRTVFLAMGYLKACLAASIVEKKELQLLAATCLYIASKYEDDRHISVSDLPFCADQIFEASEILSMEGKILNQISWVISNPTIYNFVTIWLNHIGVRENSKSFWVSLFVSELALQTDIIHSFKSSEIAAAVIAIARHSLDERVVWPEDLEKKSGYSWSDLHGPILTLSSMLEAREKFHKLKIIHRRYRKVDRMNASSILIRRIRYTDQLDR